MKRYFVVIALVIIVLVGWRVHNHSTAASRSGNSNSPMKPIPNQKPTGFDKQQYSIDQPGSIWWIVNKKRALPEGYVPPDLVAPNVAVRPIASTDEQKVRTEVAKQLEAMFAEAKNANINLMLASGYRSYQLQVSVYNKEVQQNGKAIADQESAAPGTSEHQTGMAADLEPASRQCEIADCFAETKEGQWLAQHAHKFGFIIRYQKDKQAATGYKYEPWHVRFVGTKLAAELQTSGKTMEDFFGL